MLLHHSDALHLIPREKLENEGYGEYLSLFNKNERIYKSNLRIKMQIAFITQNLLPIVLRGVGALPQYTGLTTDGRKGTSVSIRRHVAQMKETFHKPKSPCTANEEVEVLTRP